MWNIPQNNTSNSFNKLIEHRKESGSNSSRKNRITKCLLWTSKDPTLNTDCKQISLKQQGKYINRLGLNDPEMTVNFFRYDMVI